MSDEVELPSLIMKTAKSQFRLRCHAAAWSKVYGGSVQVRRRYSQDYPGLLLLSATGPDTAAKAVRARSLPARYSGRVHSAAATTPSR